MDREFTQPPSFIGKYQIIEELPRGGMAQVYRANDPDLGLLVAVKILAPELAPDTEARERFMQEARTAATLSHENIVRVFYCGEHQGRPYMVMEFLEGEDLREAIREGRTGRERDKQYVAWQAARALEYIHQRGLIHRDIKPHNIHIDREGRVRLLDFGIAKRPDFARTAPGTKMGSPYYMSPEQTRGETVTPATDIWSFGVSLYELFSGQIPFGGETPFEIARNIVEAPVDLARLERMKASDQMRALIRDCLEKDPSLRPSATEVRGDLEDMLDADDETANGDAPPEVRSAPPPPRPRTAPAARRPGPAEPPNRRPLVMVALVAAALIAALAGYWFFSRPTEPAAPLMLASASLPSGIEGQSYAGRINVEGGRRPLRWSIEQGVLPEGLSLDDGQIDGIPSGPGTYSVLVRIEDRSGQSIEEEFTFEIAPAGGERAPVIVTGAQLSEATAGQSYRQPLTAAGGEPPYLWSLVSGEMPPGLEIEGDTIQGVPSSGGNFQFTLQASDGSGTTAEKQFDLAVRRGRVERSPPKPAPPKPAKVKLASTISTSTGEMALVPAGPFLSGADKRSVHVGAFYIDKTEVTREAYGRFCGDTGRPLPRRFNEKPGNYPVVHVNVDDARAYARWAGKRLPTRQEWEKAARSTDGRLYPWGNNADTRRANVSPGGDTTGEIVPVTAHPTGASPHGVLQMLGNAWEFVDQRGSPSAEAVQQFTLEPPVTATEPWITICGGSYSEPLWRVYACTEVPARYSWYNIGFRCVKDAQ